MKKLAIPVSQDGAHDGDIAAWAVPSDVANTIRSDSELAARTQAVIDGGITEKGKSSLLIMFPGLHREVGERRTAAPPYNPLYLADMDREEASSGGEVIDELLDIAESLPGFVMGGRSIRGRGWLLFHGRLAHSESEYKAISRGIVAGIPHQLGDCCSSGQDSPARGRFVVSDPHLRFREPTESDIAVEGEIPPEPEPQRERATTDWPKGNSWPTGDEYLDSALKYLCEQGDAFKGDTHVTLADALQSKGCGPDVWRDVLRRGGCSDPENHADNSRWDRIPGGQGGAGALIEDARRRGWAFEKPDEPLRVDTTTTRKERRSGRSKGAAPEPEPEPAAGWGPPLPLTVDGLEQADYGPVLEVLPDWLKDAANDVRRQTGASIPAAVHTLIGAGSAAAVSCWRVLRYWDRELVPPGANVLLIANSGLSKTSLERACYKGHDEAEDTLRSRWEVLKAEDAEKSKGKGGRSYVKQALPLRPMLFRRDSTQEAVLKDLAETRSELVMRSSEGLIQLRGWNEDKLSRLLQSLSEWNGGGRIDADRTSDGGTHRSAAGAVLTHWMLQSSGMATFVGTAAGDGFAARSLLLGEDGGLSVERVTARRSAGNKPALAAFNESIRTMRVHAEIGLEYAKNRTNRVYGELRTGDGAREIISAFEMRCAEISDGGGASDLGQGYLARAHETALKVAGVLELIGKRLAENAECGSHVEIGRPATVAAVALVEWHYEELERMALVAVEGASADRARDTVALIRKATDGAIRVNRDGSLGLTNWLRGSARWARRDPEEIRRVLNFLEKRNWLVPTESKGATGSYFTHPDFYTAPIK